MEIGLTGEGARHVVRAGLAAATALATTKLYLLPQSGAAALLASGVQSLIDASCLALLLHGVGRIAGSARSPDVTVAARGARDLYFWSFVVAVLLHALGAGVALFEGLDKLMRPRSQVTGAGVEAALMAAGVLVSGALAWLALRRLQSSRAAGLPVWELMRRPGNSPLLTLFVLSLAGVVGHAVALAGLGGIQSGWDGRSDGIAALGVGLVMAAVAVTLAIEVRRVLVGDIVAERLRAGADEEVVPLPLPVADAAAFEVKSLPVVAARDGPAAPSPAAVVTDPAPAPSSPQAREQGKPQVHPRHQGKKGRGKRRR